MRYLQILLFIIYTSPILSFAQNCGFIFSTDEQIEHKIEASAHRLNTALSTRSVVKIPVVVHVVWKNGAENISDAQIQSQIDVLNQDFRKKNADFKDVPGSFKTVAADCEIEFCLATKDTLGRPTSGITRRQTSVDNIGASFSNNRLRVYYQDLGGSNNWKPDSFLNIWVCNMGTILGFTAPLKEALIKRNEDGVIVDYRSFGTIGTALSNSQHNKGRTTTHEIGHYFNLLHIWGNDDTCNDDDLVVDTPLQAAPNLGCPSFPQISCGIGNMFMNFMDYTDDNCMGLFTLGQKARMLATLLEFRGGLLRGGICEPTHTQDIDFQWFIYPNPAKDYIFLKIKTGILSNDNTVTITQNMGNIVLSKKLADLEKDNTYTEGGVKIPLLDFSDGMYVISLKMDNQVFVKKIVIVH
jgi:Pregnancy-associated plasma protein-A/Secretion system C-terminal sorting domain